MMAVFRPPNICPFCDEVIKEIHLDQSNVPFMFQKIGDNFLRYEDHVCDPKKKKDIPMNEKHRQAIQKWYDSLGIK